MFGRKRSPAKRNFLTIDCENSRAALDEVRRIELFLSHHQGSAHRVGVYVDGGQQKLACSCGLPGKLHSSTAGNVGSGSVAPVLREEDLDYDSANYQDDLATDMAASINEARLPTDGFVRAGGVSHRGLNLTPDLRAGRVRHRYGTGPFARLVMPDLPDAPGMYLWELNGNVVYAGQTRTPLRQRLGSNGYSTISGYNTLASEPGRSNGGQQTNCRINALANQALARGDNLVIWFRATEAAAAPFAEAAWMQRFGMPPWNRRLEG